MVGESLKLNMNQVFINQIETAVPENEFHQGTINYLQSFIESQKTLEKVNEIIPNLAIDKRFSVLGNLFGDKQNEEAFYVQGNFPSTQKRMQAYKKHALPLASQALDKLFAEQNKDEITHLIITSCTGFYSPGLDIEIIKKYGLRTDIERTIVGFMGCHAAFNALKLAKHIVSSKPDAKVLVLNIELSTLHFQEDKEMSKLISSLIFADACAASIISSKAEGLELQDFASTLIPRSLESMTWDIEDDGYAIYLDKSIPVFIKKHLAKIKPQIDELDIDCWAIHPGGKAILDIVQKALDINDKGMAFSHKVLRNYGNLSSGTIMFILKEILESQDAKANGFACAFGPGLTMESLVFEVTKVSIREQYQEKELVKQ